MKTTIRLFAVFALGCVLATHQANGDIIVEFKSVLPGSSFTLSEIVPTDGSGAAVSFPIPNANTGTWRIYSDNPAVDSINTISFTGAVNRDIKLVIGRPGVDYNPFIDPGAPALVHWVGGVSAGGAIIDVQASVSGVIGAVVANRVARLKAGQGIAGNIASTSTSTSDTMVRIEAPTIAPLLGGADPVISSSGGNIQTIAVTGNMIGSVSASNTAAINTIDVGGSMQGNASTDSGNIGTVRIGDWYVGSITSTSGNLVQLRTENGEFGGSISIGGLLQELNVATDIGIVQTTSGLVFVPTTISTTNGADMGSLSAGGAFIADISAAGNISSITAGLSLSNASVVNGQLVSETGIVSAANGTIGAVSVGTFIDADISTNTITNALDTGGDYSRGALTLSQPLAAGSQVRVGSSLASNASIQTPVAGLAGQIIINKGNAGGTWQGVVKIGPNGDPGQIVLDGAALGNGQYNNLPGAIGGGSVGLAPFALHDLGSTPPNGSAVDDPFLTSGATPAQEVRMLYYGPLLDAAAPNAPFTIQARQFSPVLGAWLPRR